MMGYRGAYAVIVLALVVTLDVFSGRPNPEWALTPAEGVEFERRLAVLPPLSVAPADQAQPLGYRGFDVRGCPTPVRVFRGLVVNGGQTFADPGRRLERWLLDSGRGSLDPSLAAYVDSEISSGP
jgi:hypothetical protein